MQRLSRRALWALARSEALASKMQDTNFLKGPICLSFLLRAMSSFQKKQANEVSRVRCPPATPACVPQLSPTCFSCCRDRCVLATS